MELNIWESSWVCSLQYVVHAGQDDCDMDPRRLEAAEAEFEMALGRTDTRHDGPKRARKQLLEASVRSYQSL